MLGFALDSKDSAVNTEPTFYLRRQLFKIVREKKDAECSEFEGNKYGEVIESQLAQDKGRLLSY